MAQEQPEKRKMDARHLNKYRQIGLLYPRTFDRVEIKDPESETYGQFVDVKTGESEFKRACRRWHKQDCAERGITVKEDRPNSIDSFFDVDTLIQLPDNMLDKIRNAYLDNYDNQIDLIERGRGRGAKPALEAVYDSVYESNKVLQYDLRRFLPDESLFSRLRFTPTTPETNDIVNRFAKARVQLSVAKSISRSLDDTARKMNKVEFDTAGLALRDHLNEIHWAHQAQFIDADLLNAGYREL